METLYNSIAEALTSLCVSVEVFFEEDSYCAKVHAPRYMNKEYVLPGSWSTEFTTVEVYKDALRRVARQYGVQEKRVGRNPTLAGYVIN